MQPDIQALALTKAIRKSEGGNYSNTTGDAGTSSGAFQYQAPTWKAYSKDILGIDNAPMTEENQNAVTYGKIKQWKDVDKLGPAEIAAKWNHGQSSGWENLASTGKGGNLPPNIINGQKVEFDTPTYVKNTVNHFRSYYDELSKEYGNTNQSNGQTFDVPNIETSAQKIARYNSESADLQKKADQQKTYGYIPTSLGALGNVGKAFTGMVASSEVGLGNTLGKIFGQNSSNAQNQASIQDTDTTQSNLLKLIRQNEGKGIDSTKLKRLYNDGEKQRQSLQASSEDINAMPTTGQAVGQLAGTALDLASFGTYGAAAKGMKSFQLAEKALPSVAGLVTKPTGFFSKKGLAKTAEGAGLGLGYGITQGMQDGDINPYHVALSTVIGGGLPALAEFGATGKNIFKPDVEKALINVAETYKKSLPLTPSQLAKEANLLKKTGDDVFTTLSKYGIDIGKDTHITQLDDVSNHFGSTINEAKVNEHAYFNLNEIKSNIKRNINDSLSSETSRGQALNKTDKEIELLLKNNKNSFIRDVNGDIKINSDLAERLRKTGNDWTPFNSADPEKVGKSAGWALADAVRDQVQKEGTFPAYREANQEWGKVLHAKQVMEKIGDSGKTFKVLGGLSGAITRKMLSGALGFHTGGIGGLVLAEMGSEYGAKILSNPSLRSYFSRAVINGSKSKNPEAIAKLANEIRQYIDSQKGLLQLEAPKSIITNAPRGENSVALMSAEKNPITLNPKTGEAQTTYSSSPYKNVEPAPITTQTNINKSITIIQDIIQGKGLDSNKLSTSMELNGKPITQDAEKVLTAIKELPPEFKKNALDVLKEEQPVVFNEVKGIIETQNKARYDKYQSMKDQTMTEKMGSIYEPYTKPEDLPVIDMGNKPKVKDTSGLPEIQMNPIERKTGQSGMMSLGNDAEKLYHGTADKFDKFDTTKMISGNQGKGIYMTDNPELAKYYSMQQTQSKDLQSMTKGSLDFKDRRIGEVKSFNIDTNAKIKELPANPTKDMVAKAKAEGYDGIKFKDTLEKEDWNSEILGNKIAQGNTTLLFNDSKIVYTKANQKQGKAGMNPLTVGAGVAGAIAGSMAMSKKGENK